MFGCVGCGWNELVSISVIDADPVMVIEDAVKLVTGWSKVMVKDNASLLFV